MWCRQYHGKSQQHNRKYTATHQYQCLEVSTLIEPLERSSLNYFPATTLEQHSTLTCSHHFMCDSGIASLQAVGVLYQCTGCRTTPQRVLGNVTLNSAVDMLEQEQMRCVWSHTVGVRLHSISTPFLRWGLTENDHWTVVIATVHPSITVQSTSPGKRDPLRHSS